MYLIYEALFYLGLIAIGIGLLWLLIALIGRRWNHARLAGIVVALGIISIGTPFFLTSREIVDLGPRMTLVQGEKTITLTGWDRDDYSFLVGHPETIVLQMANADVTDQTLQHLRGMANLRELDLNGTQVTDAGLLQLQALTALEVLRLRGTAVTDQGMSEHLSRLPKLQRLDLRQTSVSKEAIDSWKSAGERRRVQSDH